MTRRIPRIAVLLLAAGITAGGGATGGEVLLERARALASLNDNTGGFTYSFRRGNLAGADVYAVAMYPERSAIIPGSPSEWEIARYVERNSDLLKDPRFAVGGWQDRKTCNTYLDVSTVVPTRERAVALGKKKNQKAVMYLRTLEEIPTGGTGEAR